MSGFRVAVTTADDAADSVARRVDAAGLVPVVLPCIRVVPAAEDVLSPIRDRARSADWIVATSRRAIEITWPDGSMPPVAVAAVGPVTAAAVTAAGGRVALVGNGDSRRLLDLLGPRLDGSGVVFPHARATDPGIVGELRSLAEQLWAGPVYDTLPIGPAAVSVDGALFASPSAVAGWLTTRVLDGLVIGAIGTTTAGRLAGEGHPPEVVPDEPGFDHLIAAFAAHTTHRRIHS